MATHRLFVLAAACALCGQITFADSRESRTNVEKTKREVNIIGPIPTRYRGQATGQTTFDGILADDLQLPATDSGRYQTQSASPPRFGQLGAQDSAATARFGQFQVESRPEVYNFDGKEQVTYDGVLASDLMVPYAQFTGLSQQARSVQPKYFRQRVPQTTATQPIFQKFQSQRLQPVVRQADFDDSYKDDLTPPSPAPNQLQAFQQARTVPTNVDPSQFQPETPWERYNRIQQQYQATLAEYRNSLIRFQDQLNKYSSFSKNK